LAFRLKFTPSAERDLKELARSAGLRKRFKSVQKALGQLELNPRRPGLQTHKFESLRGPNGEEVFEAYAEHKTPAAYRIFFFYDSSERGVIWILAITPHP